MQTSLAPTIPLHFHSTEKSTDELALAPPKSTEAKWKQLGLRIERNCSDDLYRKIVKDIVDLYGWDNSAHDYAMWLQIFGPSRFNMFFALDQDSNPVGVVTMALYPEVAQLSLFYVNEHFRGLQLGHTLFRQAIDFAGDRPVFLYGVADMWAKYANEFGMDHFLDWRLWSMSAHCANVCPERIEDDQSVELKEWSELPFAEICKFDRMQTAGLDRSAYLREALRRPQSAAQVAVCKKTREMVGMCQARQLLNHRLGVHLFYADNPSVASALLRSVLLQFAGSDPSARFSTLVYNTPSTNKDSVRLFDRLTQGNLLDRQELTPQFSRRALHFPANRIYCIGDEHVSLI